MPCFAVPPVDVPLTTHCRDGVITNYKIPCFELGAYCAVKGLQGKSEWISYMFDKHHSSKAPALNYNQYKVGVPPPVAPCDRDTDLTCFPPTSPSADRPPGRVGAGAADPEDFVPRRDPDQRSRQCWIDEDSHFHRCARDY